MDNKITKASYTLKRLRDCGYKADKIIGVCDPISLENDLEKLLGKLFPEQRMFSSEEVKSTIKRFKTDIIRRSYICPNYDIRDARVWTILVDGGRDNIYLTYYNNFKDVGEKYEELGNDFFEIYDGGQYTKPLRIKLKTASIEVLVKHLTDIGITKKCSE
mgnify:CR=1 FL=1